MLNYTNTTAVFPSGLPTTVNGSNSTFDEVAYLESYLGERRVGTVSIVFLTFIYITIFLSGTIGNVCTCIVIARNRNMHTATNYYLFSLAISDLCTLILGKSFFSKLYCCLYDFDCY